MNKPQSQLILENTNIGPIRTAFLNRILLCTFSTSLLYVKRKRNESVLGALIVMNKILLITFEQGEVRIVKVPTIQSVAKSFAAVAGSQIPKVDFVQF
uniref:SFRICE_011772 n=1 Tax=Spodoptera frugiperda TaxID=7108 RepID=A0A2H1VAZ5_SPOFR